MSYYEIPGQTQFIPSDTEWTDDFLQAIYDFEQGRGSRLSYLEKQGYWLLFQASGGVFNVIADADSDTLTSTLLAGISVTAIGMDGTLRPAVDRGIQLWRKGNLGDTDEQVLASNTITLVNGSSFFNGQTVTILKSAS